LDASPIAGDLEVLLMGKIIAFVSYAHADDVYDRGAISYLAQGVERALNVFTARSDLAVFVDRKSIDWGDAWRARVAEGLADSTVLIAIVTPNFLSSEECRSETEAFIRLPRWDRWLLPIYYMEVDDFDTRKDPVTAAVRSVQYIDWRQLRTLGRDTLKVHNAIEQLAKDIRGRLRTTLAKSSKQPVVVSNPSREYRAQVVGDDAATSDWAGVLVAAHAAREDDEFGLARALLLHGIDRFANAWLVWELASVDWYEGALDDAVAGFERALDMPPDEEFSKIRVLHNLGQARIERGEFERGIADLTTVIEHPDGLDIDEQAYARSARALGLGSIGRFQEAIEELAAAERVTPENAWLHFNRARVLDLRGDPAACASYVRSLVLQSPPLNRPKRQMAQQRLRDLGWQA
jgi:tetratricopeptide (TPR) repeat protein